MPTLQRPTMISSLLDTDLYKLTMQATLAGSTYANLPARYEFTNRGGNRFTRAAADSIRDSVLQLASLRLTQEERTFLESTDLFRTEYLDFLQQFRFNPAQHVTVTFTPTEEDGMGSLDIVIEGTWLETILYEIPIMAIISATYFNTVDTKWDYAGQLELAKEKGKQLFGAGCMLSEFGSRRRRSYRSQKIVLRGLTEVSKEMEGKGKGKLVGTSNVHFAMRMGLKPIGTMAHEFIMAIGAIEGYVGANARAMDLWETVYTPPKLAIALTDTFTLEPFFADFIANPARARSWAGMRQDSGSPFEFITRALDAWNAVGVLFGEEEKAAGAELEAERRGSRKMIVFSDGLDVPKCLLLQVECEKVGVAASFGVGTCLTNDFQMIESPLADQVESASEETIGSGPIRRDGESSTALNMVIKIRSIDDKPCIKISEDSTKFTGEASAVKAARKALGLP